MPSRPPSLKKAKARKAWDHRQPSSKRGLGADHRAIRRQLLIDEPLCRECDRNGIVTPAVIADHIIPRAEGGRNEWSNYQPLCKPCHDEKTLAEAQRGRAA